VFFFVGFFCLFLAKVAKSPIGRTCSKKIGNGPSSLGRFSQIWLYEIQNLNCHVMFFGYTLKTKNRNLLIFPSFFFSPLSLLAIDLQNHFIFKIFKILFIFLSSLVNFCHLKKKANVST